MNSLVIRKLRLSYIVQPNTKPRVVRLSGEELEIYAENEVKERAARLSHFNSDILITY